MRLLSGGVSVGRRSAAESHDSPYAAGANRRSLRRMSAAAVGVIIVLVIILVIGLLTGAVFLARKLDRDEPGPTVVRSYKDEYRRGGSGGGGS